MYIHRYLYITVHTLSSLIMTYKYPNHFESIYCYVDGAEIPISPPGMVLKACK